METYLTLVNAAHPLEDEDRRKLEEHLMPADENFPEILMEETAARALRALLRELGAEGQIVPVSGYRTNGGADTDLRGLPAGKRRGIYKKNLWPFRAAASIRRGWQSIWAFARRRSTLSARIFPTRASVRNFVKWRRITALWSAIRRARKRSQESVMSPGTSAMWGGPTRGS